MAEEPAWVSNPDYALKIIDIRQVLFLRYFFYVCFSQSYKTDEYKITISSIYWKNTILVFN